MLARDRQLKNISHTVTSSLSTTFYFLGHACSSSPVDSTHLDKDSPPPDNRIIRTRAYAAKSSVKRIRAKMEARKATAP